MDTETKELLKDLTWNISQLNETLERTKATMTDLAQSVDTLRNVIEKQR